MIIQFLHIRYCQIKRSLSDLTIFHGIALLCILFFFGLALISILSKINEHDTWVVVAVAAFAILYMHLSRPDKRLVFIIREKPYAIFFIEYFIATLPFFLFLIYLKNGLAALTFVALLFCISLINKDLYQVKGTSIFSKLLPPTAFEWRAGMRKMGIWLVLFYVLALAVSGIRVAPFIFLFFALTAITQFYYACEPLSILCLKPYTAATFLRKKIGQSLLIYSVITIPIILLAMLLVPELWFVGIIFYVLACVNIANAILLKYTFFHPNRQTGGGGVLASLSLLGSIIPFLAPVPILMIGWYYYKAHQKLKYYLND